MKCKDFRKFRKIDKEHVFHIWQKGHKHQYQNRMEARDTSHCEKGLVFTQDEFQLPTIDVPVSFSKEPEQEDYDEVEVTDVVLGKGAFGTVSIGIKTCKAGSKIHVAVKKVVLDDLEEMAHEIEFLNKFKHKNIVGFYGTVDTDTHCHIVLELAFMDLNQFQKQYSMSFNTICRLGKDLLTGLDYLHEKNIVHRDLKPANLLVFKQADGHLTLKISDLGCAKYVHFNTQSTSYICTRWYRPPELLNAAMDKMVYGTELDMWSVGCILGELIMESPLFPGSSTDHQVILTARVNVRKACFDVCRVNMDLGNIVEKLLRRPSKRMTAKEALKNAIFNV